MPQSQSTQSTSLQPLPEKTIPGALAFGESRFTGWPAILSATVIIRLCLIAAACWGARIQFDQIALFHDGWEYLRMSRAFAHFHPRQLDLQNVRLFPGYPVAIAVLSLGRYFEAAAIAISILAAAGCARLTGRLGRNPSLAWWMIALTPSWLLYTSVAMAEGLSTLLILVGLLLTIERRWVWAGLAAGAAVVVRPVGAFVFVPILWEAFVVQRDRRATMKVLAAGVPLPLIYLVASRILWGDALKSVNDYSSLTHSYGPLVSFITDTLNPKIALVKKALVWGTLGITWVGAWGLWRQWRGDGTKGGKKFKSDDRQECLSHVGGEWARPLFLWHFAAAGFYLLSPGDWVFACIDRYYAALWPTTLIGLSLWMPRRRGWVVGLCGALGALSFLIAWKWLVNMAAVFPFTERMLR